MISGYLFCLLYTGSGEFVLFSDLTVMGDHAAISQECCVDHNIMFGLCLYCGVLRRDRIRLYLGIMSV